MWFFTFIPKGLIVVICMLLLGLALLVWEFSDVIFTIIGIGFVAFWISTIVGCVKAAKEKEFGRAIGWGLVAFLVGAYIFGR